MSLLIEHTEETGPENSRTPYMPNIEKKDEEINQLRLSSKQKSLLPQSKSLWVKKFSVKERDIILTDSRMSVFRE